MTMVYELLDEIVDFGYIQNTNTDGLKIFVFNESQGASVDVNQKFNLSKITDRFVSKKTIESTATNMSVQDQSKNKNSIFVDLIEKIHAVFDYQGNIIRSEVVGCLNMKSYLLGQPIIRLGLTEDLVIGQGGSYGQVRIDNCSFSDMVKLNEFQQRRVISLTPPNGEFDVMNYRKTNAVHMPFRVFPYIEHDPDHRFKFTVVFKIRADYEKDDTGTKMMVYIPLPKTTSNVTVEFGVGSSQTYEWKQQDKMIVWGIQKFIGKTDQVIRIKMSLEDPPTYDIHKQIGPISLKFEMPMHNITGLQVRSLKFDNVSTSKPPGRWIRYITKGENFEVRLARKSQK
eukprot:CAMPEP_0117419272 /NCGR_PEP_ID=MMETSP0758-20121206/869_1 /TAXON_ID=63605 /ORGANISM="Percolomonas cosmopolitus, Strain AE-1 (ATCC 50343)" /LENGTH=340 /DNA_ID=CAMNT_0005200241 /DNA_START=290 /DNA_END=1312 /DNA_ORIENTATION=+